MKITKRQLMQIIKEEKAKLLLKEDANAERALGSYANSSSVDALTEALLNILQEVEMGAIEDGLEEDEAEDMAADAVLLAVAQAFQSAGLTAEYSAVYNMIGK